MQDWQGTSAAELGRDIGAGRIDPRDLTEAFLEAIDAHPEAARIYARTTAQRARAEAASASERARSGTRRSQLDGVPISWKDLFDTAGVATESGSRLLAGRVPDTDAAVLANATRAGLVCLGKTHMTELAFSGLGLNPMTATPPNGLDPDLAPGGSSSGAAVSVRLGLAAGAIGSDTGGSIRLPAAWNDLVGYKPSHGSLPMAGIVPLAARFDTPGPLARTLEDAALLAAALGDVPATDLSGASLAGVRLAVCGTVALDGLEPDPARALDGAIAALGRAGAQVSTLVLPQVAQAMALAAPLYTVEAYATWGDEIEANPDAIYPPVRERFCAGARYSGVEYVRAWATLDGLRAELAEQLSGYDAMILPSVPILPPATARLLADEAYFTERNLLALRNTRIGNLMGMCGLSLPTGVRHCGLMVLALPGQDARLLRLGAAIEAALA